MRRLKKTRELWLEVPRMKYVKEEYEEVEKNKGTMVGSSYDEICEGSKERS